MIIYDEMLIEKALVEQKRSEVNRPPCFGLSSFRSNNENVHKSKDPVTQALKTRTKTIKMLVLDWLKCSTQNPRSFN